MQGLHLHQPAVNGYLGEYSFVICFFHHNNGFSVKTRVPHCDLSKSRLDEVRKAQHQVEEEGSLLSQGSLYADPIPVKQLHSPEKHREEGVWGGSSEDDNMGQASRVMFYPSQTQRVVCG